ncbi:MAG: hypothetical protein KGN16_07780 [Burkholderiales bacterium]|nr:hypothetical protein [Burkholderiales bacterium]
MKSPTLACALAAALLTLPPTPARAFDATWSGFATLGYAISNSRYTEQGSIVDRGTFRRDTLAAEQLDLRLSPQWSATLQALAAPAQNNDDRWRLSAEWAFVAWRPDNDWLLRAGKTRLPLYLYSESLDIGVASDMARLPYEMYSISPTNEFTGLFVTRNFGQGERDFSVDLYDGAAHTDLRVWLRDGQAPQVAAGALYDSVKVEVRGLVVTARDPRLTWRLGIHSATTRRSDGQPLPVTYPWVALGPGIGYWQVSSELPGPGLQTVTRVRNLALTAGAEWNLGDGWRMAGEFVRMLQHDTQLGSDSRAGYLALFKRIDAWTPYLSVARQRSSDGLLAWRAQLIGATLPAGIPGGAPLVAAERVAGESVYAADQTSIALGASYAVSPTAKLKAELLRTRVGAASAHFDPPPGYPDAKHLSVNTLSINFNIAY